MENAGILSGVLFPTVLIIALITFLARLFIKLSRDARALKEEELYELDRNAEIEIEPLAEKAKVISKQADGYYSGPHQTPTYHSAFIVSFMTESGETKTFNVVQKETFDRIREGKSGMLLTINGNFFDFGEGNDISVDE